MSSASQSKRSSIASNQPKPARIYLHILDYETREFSGLTTYHGLVRIYNSRTWPSRIFWCVTVVSCLSLFMIHSGILLWGFYQKPTVTQINVMVPPDGLLFPDVTICNINPVSKQRIEGKSISSSLLQYLFYFYENRVLKPWPGILEQHEEYVNFAEQEENATAKPFDALEFFASVGHSCAETVVECYWAGEKLENCCDLAETVMTEYGKCFRFSNKMAKRRQWFAGWNFGFEFVLDSRFEDRPENLPDRFSDLGMKLLVHQSSEFPVVDSNPISVPPGEKLYAGIDVFNKTHLPQNDWGSCQPGWSEKKHGQILVPFNYSSGHCAANCAMNSMMDHCGCVRLVDRIAGNESICTPLQITECYQRNASVVNLFCDCPIECFHMDYFILPSYTLLDFEGSDDSRLSQVSIYMKEISYEHHEQQKQLQMADLLSNIAGSMGLFLGMSTVTLLEIFIYLFKSVWGTVNTERERQFVRAMIEEEAERRQSLVIVEEGGEDTESEFGAMPEDRRMSRRSSRFSLYQQQPFMLGRRQSHLRRPSMMRRSSEQFTTENGDKRVSISFDPRPRQSVSYFDRRPSTVAPTDSAVDERRRSMFDSHMRRKSMFNQRASYFDDEEHEQTPVPPTGLPPSACRQSVFDTSHHRRQSLRPPGDDGVIDYQPMSSAALQSRRLSTQSRILGNRRPSIQSNNDLHVTIVNSGGGGGRRRSSIRLGHGLSQF